MNLTRRKFFRGLAVAPVVAVVAAKLPPLPAPPIRAFLTPKKLTTIRIGMPVPQWRELYKGVLPFKINRTPLSYWRTRS